MSDSVDSVSSVSCRDTEIVNTNSNHTSAHELMLQSSDGRSNTTLQTTELQFGGLLAPVIHPFSAGSGLSRVQLGFAC